MCDCKYSCACPKFNPSKPVQCKDGKKARILATDLEAPWSIAAVVLVGGNENLYRFTKEGKLQGYAAHNFDLVNIPETKEKFLNVYSHSGGSLKDSLKESKDSSSRTGTTFTGRIKIVYTDGKMTAVELLK